MNSKIKVLGISGSLRNARFAKGSEKLVIEINKISSQDLLIDYLKRQTKIRSDEFLEAGLNESKPFDEVYQNLLKTKGDRGLSNSEAALAAGLWGCVQEGAEIHHAGLSSYFPMNGKTKYLEKLKRIILDCDALLISGPVYFGDRSSLIQSFVEFVTSDHEILAHLKGKTYAGISVGAKRNGGQETQLIYQMLDMANLDMLALGNSAETTSQYGGTVVAGDIGTAWSDNYGLNTAIGTGKRLARVANTISRAKKTTLHDKVRIGIWLVQDDNHHTGLNHITNLISNVKASEANIEVLDITQEEIYRCIACDLCPTHHAPREEYACIIKSKDDVFVNKHAELMDVDAILLAAYSPIHRGSINSVYQRFIERTRYVRRGHYMWGDRLVAPLVISEMDANQNLHIRMLTSLIRHHTVLQHPILGFEHNGTILNMDLFKRRFSDFLQRATDITKARLAQDVEHLNSTYNPIGYDISDQRNKDDHRSGRMLDVQENKRESFNNEREKRLGSENE